MRKGGPASNCRPLWPRWGLLGYRGRGMHPGLPQGEGSPDACLPPQLSLFGQFSAAKFYFLLFMSCNLHTVKCPGLTG